MPLTILAGMVVAVLLFSDLTVWEAAILAIILAPTDASLGAAVVNSRFVPVRSRQALSVESGLNDGLSIPLLMLFIALAQVESPTHDTSWIVFTIQQIGFGLLVNLALGWVGGRLMANAEQRGLMTKAAQQLALLALAILSWGFAEKVIGGNGFIAAFIAGSMIKYSFESAHGRNAEFDEAWVIFLHTLSSSFLGNCSAIFRRNNRTTLVLCFIKPDPCAHASGSDRINRRHTAARFSALLGLVRSTRAGLYRYGLDFS